MHEKIEEAFGTLTKVVLGKKLENMQDYEEWLITNVRVEVQRKSAISDEVFYIPPFLRFMLTKEKIVSFEESFETLGKRMVSAQEAKGLDLSNAAQKLKEISYYTPEVRVGENFELERCSITANSSYGYRLIYFAECKFCACSMWPRESEYIFGSEIVFSSKFCLKCYNSSYLTRCFEVSNSTMSSDCYFCHNIENCTECMFCFNVKSKRYAIGNTEYPREEYMRIKKLVLDEIVGKLEKGRKLDLNIFNIGCSLPTAD
ncbi:MAG: hypothetical protein ABIH83_02775 [Candidatus Micrarchaeota archaeon]